jgi:hypothetical protein
VIGVLLSLGLPVYGVPVWLEKWGKLLGVVRAEGEVEALNAWALAGIGALVGLFSRRAMGKLREIFKTMFRTEDRHAPREGEAWMRKFSSLLTPGNQVKTIDLLEPDHPALRQALMARQGDRFVLLFKALTEDEGSAILDNSGLPPAARELLLALTPASTVGPQEDDTSNEA